MKIVGTGLILMLLAGTVPGGCTAEKSALGGNVLAVVDGEALTPGGFSAFLESRGVSLSSVPLEGREEMVREYVTDWKLAKEARRKGLDRRDPFTRMAMAFDRKTLPDLYYRLEFLDRTEIEEKDFESLFQGLEEYAALRVAVLPTERKARDFLARVNSGERFEKLAGKESIGHSALVRGFIPFVKITDVRFTYEEKQAIFSTSPGQNLGPFENKLGSFSVIQVESIRSVEQQKEDIRKEKTEETRARKARFAYLSRLNREIVKSEIEINEQYYSREKSGNEPKSPYLAWVKGKYIYPEDLNVFSRYHDKSENRSSLDEAIMSIIATDLAVEAGLKNAPEYKEKREAFEVDYLSRIFIESENRKSKIVIGEEEIQEYYRKNYKPEVFSIYLLTNKSKDVLEETRGKIREGENLGEVAMEVSDDPSRAKRGVVRYFPITAFDPAVAERIRSLKVNEVSDVFRVADKYAVIMVLEKAQVPVPSLEKVRDDIRNKLRLQKRSEFVIGLREKTLKKLSIRINRETLEKLQ
jgi:parvulin-like peptidyl-prolyl isomerase